MAVISEALWVVSDMAFVFLMCNIVRDRNTSGHQRAIYARIAANLIQA